jgi:putative membrane protein
MRPIIVGLDRTGTPRLAIHVTFGHRVAVQPGSCAAPEISQLPPIRAFNIVWQEMVQTGCMRFLIRVLVTAVALWVATAAITGITVSGRSAGANALTLLAVAVIFGIINAVIKPIVKIFGCVFYLLTLGLIAVVVNAGLFLLTSWIAGTLNLPFHVAGFWSAFWGAIIVGVVSWLIMLIIPDRKAPVNDR